jgi:hypothetical protein
LPKSVTKSNYKPTKNKYVLMVRIGRTWTNKFNSIASALDKMPLWSRRHPSMERCKKHCTLSNVTVISPLDIWKLLASTCHLFIKVANKGGSRYLKPELARPHNPKASLLVSWNTTQFKQLVPMTVSLPGFPFLPLILNFGTRFSKFFLPW